MSRPTIRPTVACGPARRAEQRAAPRPAFFFSLFADWIFAAQLGENGPWPTRAQAPPAPRPQPGPGPGNRHPAWAENGPVPSWPLISIQRCNEKFAGIKTAGRHLLSQTLISFFFVPSPAQGQSRRRRSSLLLFCARAQGRRRRFSSAQHSGRQWPGRAGGANGAATSPLAGARARSWRSAPPSSGFVCGASRGRWVTASRVGGRFPHSCSCL